jgi:hypothetical protein
MGKDSVIKLPGITIARAATKNPFGSVIIVLDKIFEG